MYCLLKSPPQKYPKTTNQPAKTTKKFLQNSIIERYFFHLGIIFFYCKISSRKSVKDTDFKHKY